MQWFVQKSNRRRNFDNVPYISTCSVILSSNLTNSPIADVSGRPAVGMNPTREINFLLTKSAINPRYYA